MNLVCPKCGSGDVRSYESIHQSGTHTGRIGGYEHTASSALAESVAPPTPADSGQGGCGCLVGVAFIALIVGVAVHDPIVKYTLLALILIPGLWFVAKTFTETDDSYPAAYAAWQRSFYCLRCAHRFYV
jgi:hypothetical protein